MKILDGFSMKVSGFAEPLKVKTKEAKLDFPSRHDWDIWFLKNQINENKPGERPDTVYLAKIPVKWFSVSLNFSLQASFLQTKYFSRTENLTYLQKDVFDRQWKRLVLSEQWIFQFVIQ